MALKSDKAMKALTHTTHMYNKWELGVQHRKTPVQMMMREMIKNRLFIKKESNGALQKKDGNGNITQKATWSVDQ